ncbi:MAG: long-chain fatty acid--CoA ligase, partial [Alphaproteobacteria bacterium]|nr:long-chain fatty acid--CoA ligase [Alphaproteobacteria bacterium]
MNSPVDLARHDTMPKLMAHNAEKWPDRIAVREKDLGIWIERTWRESLDETSAIACGLVEIGLRPGEVVGLIGQNRPGLLYGQVAAHAAGGMSLGIYEDALAEEVGYLVAFAGAAVILAEDEEQVDKFLDLGDRIPTVRWIVYADPRGMRKHDDPRLMTLASLKERGRARLAKEPDFFRRLVAADDGERVAVLCTTSGTTAHPKLASMAAGPMLRHAAALLHLEAKGPDDQYVSVLPMPWVGEQINAVAQHLVSGIVVNFVEDKTTTNHDLREIGPTTLLYPPRVWEGVQADIKARIMDSSWLKRRFYEIGIDLGLKALDRGERSWLADLLVGRALRDRIGFSRLRSATTGGAALGPDTFRFFRAIGVPLRQVYGQTETAGIHCGHPEGDIDYDTV